MTLFAHTAFSRLLLAGLMLGAGVPAAAATPGGYSATLATPTPAAKKAIVNGVVWHCEGDSCTAAIDGSRPVIACGRMVRSFGAVTRFATPKGELAADELARCNTAAN